ncbi:MAG: hypothetical protein RLZZ596_2791, partial [Pseudomonadota bacterium]
MVNILFPALSVMARVLIAFAASFLVPLAWAWARMRSPC